MKKKLLLPLLMAPALLVSLTSAVVPGTTNPRPVQVKRISEKDPYDLSQKEQQVINSLSTSFKIDDEDCVFSNNVINFFRLIFDYYTISDEICISVLNQLEAMKSYMIVNHFNSTRNPIIYGDSEHFTNIFQYINIAVQHLNAEIVFNYGDGSYSIIQNSETVFSDDYPSFIPLDHNYTYAATASSDNSDIVDTNIIPTTVYDNLAVSPITRSNLFNESYSATVLNDVIEYCLISEAETINGEVLLDIRFDVLIYQYENFFKKNCSYKINLNNFPGEMRKSLTSGIDDYISNVSIVMDSGNGEGYIYFDVIKEIPRDTQLFYAYKCGNRYVEATQNDLDLAIEEYNQLFTGDNCIVSSIQEQDNNLHDGETKNIYLDVDSGYSEAQILAEISAKDLFGQDVAVTVESSDYQTGKTGTFTIIVKATDKYNQTATASLIVNVIDYTAPTINQKNDVIYTYNSVVTESMLLSNFTFSDNMGVSGLTYQFTYPSGFDISKPLVFGNYSLIVKATDSFGNSTSKDFNLSVIDETAPIISKKEGMMSDKVGIGYSSLGDNTLARILDLYKAVDAIDGNCDIYLKSGKIPTDMIGDFTLTIASTDKSGNEAISTITLEVIADIPPVFILSDKLISTTVSNPLSFDDLVRVVQNGLLRNVNASQIVINASGYLADPLSVKDHSVSYTYLDDEGMGQSGYFTLRVSDDSQLDPVEPVKEDNFFLHAFKTIFSSNINKASALDWFVVVATILVPLLLIGFLFSKGKRR